MGKKFDNIKKWFGDALKKSKSRNSANDFLLNGEPQIEKSPTSNVTQDVTHDQIDKIIPAADDFLLKTEPQIEKSPTSNVTQDVTHDQIDKMIPEVQKTTNRSRWYKKNKGNKGKNKRGKSKNKNKMGKNSDSFEEPILQETQNESSPTANVAKDETSDQINEIIPQKIIKNKRNFLENPQKFLKNFPRFLGLTRTQSNSDNSSSLHNDDLPSNSDKKNGRKFAKVKNSSIIGKNFRDLWERSLDKYGKDHLSILQKNINSIGSEVKHSSDSSVNLSGTSDSSEEQEAQEDKVSLPGISKFFIEQDARLEHLKLVVEHLKLVEKLVEEARATIKAFGTNKDSTPKKDIGPTEEQNLPNITLIQLIETLEHYTRTLKELSSVKVNIENESNNITENTNITLKELSSVKENIENESSNIQKNVKAKKASVTSCDLDKNQTNTVVTIPLNPFKESNLRYIVIDGSNVAREHGKRNVFSCKGIQLVVDHFAQRGHTNITAIIPRYRRGAVNKKVPTVQPEILDDLEKKNFLVYSPSRNVDNELIIPYDDRFIIKAAAYYNAIIVSNDNYRDLMLESAEWKKMIQTNLLQYTFVGDLFLVPDDPMGRRGPHLDELLANKPIKNNFQSQLKSIFKKTKKKEDFQKEEEKVEQVYVRSSPTIHIPYIDEDDGELNSWPTVLDNTNATVTPLGSPKKARFPKSTQSQKERKEGKGFLIQRFFQR